LGDISLVQLAGRPDELLSPEAVGRIVHAARGTVRRWILDGAQNSAGQVVRLQAVRIGRVWRTTRPALRRFLEELNEPANGVGGGDNNA
jgi:hypothetical protein